jgi:small subunit ribosomal protein S16
LAVRIRLQRAGRKKRPFYRIVVADARSNRDGRYIERLGHYDPVPAEQELVVDAERALYWLRQGAQPSDSVRSLLRRAGVWAAFRAPGAGQSGPDANAGPAEA